MTYQEHESQRNEAYDITLISDLTDRLRRYMAEGTLGRGAFDGLTSGDLQFLLSIEGKHALIQSERQVAEKLLDAQGGKPQDFSRPQDDREGL